MRFNTKIEGKAEVVAEIDTFDSSSWNEPLRLLQINPRKRKRLHFSTSLREMKLRCSSCRDSPLFLCTGWKDVDLQIGSMFCTYSAIHLVCACVVVWIDMQSCIGTVVYVHWEGGGMMRRCRHFVMCVVQISVCVLIPISIYMYVGMYIYVDVKSPLGWSVYLLTRQEYLDNGRT